MQHHDIADRDDAQIAKYAQAAPKAFARLLMTLIPSERAVMQQRATHGLAWLRRQAQEQAPDNR